MNRSHVVHLKNKYPGCSVQADDHAIDVFDNASGEHLMSVRKNGAGQWVDVSEELGLPERFSLEPIPKEARVWAHSHDGKIVRHAKADDREIAREQFIHEGKVLSQPELEKEGFVFDRDGFLKTVPAGHDRDDDHRGKA